MLPFDQPPPEDEDEFSWMDDYVNFSEQQQQQEQMEFELAISRYGPNDVRNLRAREQRAAQLGKQLYEIPDSIPDQELDRQVLRTEIENNVQYMPISKRALSDPANRRLLNSSTAMRQTETLVGKLGNRGLTRAGLERRVSFLAFKELVGGTLNEDELVRFHEANNELIRLAETADELNFAESTANIVAHYGSTISRQFPTAAGGGAIGGAIGAAFYGASNVIKPLKALGLFKKASTAVVGGGKMGFRAGLIFDSYVLNAGQAYLEFSEMTDAEGFPLDPTLARGGAFMTGLFNAGLDVVGTEALLRRVPGVGRLTQRLDTRGGSKELVRRLLQTDEGRSLLRKASDLLIDAGSMGGLEAGLEMLQEAIIVGTGEALKETATAIDANDEFRNVTAGEFFGRLYDAGTQGGIAAAGLRLAVAPTRIPFEMAQVRHREKYGVSDETRLNRIDAAIDAIANDETLSQDRDATEQFINQVIETTGQDDDGTIYIDPETLAQTAEDNGVDLIDLLGRLKISQQEFTNAEETGGTVKATVGSVVAEAASQNKANNEFRKGLMDIVRYNPDSFNRQELDAWRKMTPEERLKEVVPMLQRAYKDEEFNRNSQQVHRIISEQLKGVGRFGKTVTKVQADVTALQYMVLAKRLGITPMEAFARYPVKFAGTRLGSSGKAGKDAYGQIVYRAREDGYKGFDPADSVEWNEASEKGLDLSEEARFKRAKEQGYNINLPLFRGYSLSNVYAGAASKLKGAFKDLRDLRPLGKHRHIFFSEEQDFAEDFGEGGAESLLPDNDPQTGLPWEPERRKEVLAEATDNTVFKMFLRGKILDLSDPAQGPIFLKELEQLLAQDEQALQQGMDEFVAALFADNVPEHILEYYLDAIADAINEGKNDFAKTELRAGRRDYEKTKDKDALRKDVTKAIFYYLGGSDQYVVGGRGEDTFYLDKDHNDKDTKTHRLPLSLQLLASNNWLAAGELLPDLRPAEQLAALNKLSLAAAKFAQAHNGREITLANVYRPAFLGMKDHYLTKWQMSVGDNPADRFDWDDNFWEVVEKQASHYIEAAGYAAYKMKEFGRITYGVVDYRNVRSPLAAFDPEYVGVSGGIYEQQIEGGKERRGEYAPDLSEVRLLTKANLSTFTHEMGHHWLEVHNTIALEIAARMADGQATTLSETQLVMDVNLLIAEMARQTNETIPEKTQPLEWFASKTFEQRKNMHEVFARMSEAYFFEGKAPLPELQKLFRTLARFIVGVYKEIRRLNVELTPEVREVFDRMHAAEEDLQYVKDTDNLNPMFLEKPPMMTDEEWRRYQDLGADADNDALETLRTRTLRNIKWLERAKSKYIQRLQAAAKEQRAAVRDEVSERVNQRKVYKAIKFIRRGFDASGNKVEGAHKLDIDILAEIMGKSERWKKLGYGRSGMLAKGEKALDPRLMADILGYRDVKTMINALLDAEDINKVIEAETDKIMLERFGDMEDAKAQEQAANEAVQSELRERMLRAEFAALNKMVGKTSRLGTALFGESGRTAAQTIVGRMDVKSLNINQFIGAARRAGVKADKALMADDIETAAAAKRDQILNFMIVREIHRQNAKRAKALKFFQKVRGGNKETLSKNRDYDLVQAARALLAVHGLSTEVQAEKVREYLETLRKYDEDTYDNIVAATEAAISEGKTFDNMSVDEFNSLYEMVTSFWELSRSSKQIEIDGKKLEIDQIAEEVKRKVDELTARRGRGKPPPPDVTQPSGAEDKRVPKAMKWAYRYATSLRRMENMMFTMDGSDSTDSPFFLRIFHRPISQAADKYRRTRANYLKRYRKLWDMIADQKGLFDPIVATEFKAWDNRTNDWSDQPIVFENKLQLLDAILNMGNQSNYQKMLLGWEWGALTEDGKLDDRRWKAFIERLIEEEVLTKQDFDFVQGIWDLFKDMKPEAQKAHKRLKGRYFDEISAEPMTNSLGTWAGGYVPMQYDFNQSKRGLPQSEKIKRQERWEKGEAPSQYFPNSANGFTKTRSNFHDLTMFDLHNRVNHIDQVLKFTYMGPVLKDMQKLLDNPTINKAFKDYSPLSMENVIIPFMERAMTQRYSNIDPKTQAELSAFARWARRGAGMNLMILNLANSFMAIGSAPLAMLKVHPKWLAQANLNFVANPKAFKDGVYESSMMMRNRHDQQMSRQLQEIDELATPNRNKLKQLGDFFEQYVYVTQQLVQIPIDLITWQAAYNQAMDESGGIGHDDAVARADSAVRTTMVGFSPEDQSYIESRTEIEKAILQFYSYFNMWGNALYDMGVINRRDHGALMFGPRMLGLVVIGYLVPQILAESINKTIKGSWPEDEEGDGVLDNIAAEVAFMSVRGLTGFFPYFGQATSLFFSDLTPQRYDDYLNMGAGVSMFQKSTRSTYEFFEDMGKWAIGQGYDVKAADKIRDAGDVFTFATRIPVNPITDRVAVALEMHEGEIYPTDPIDAARTIVTGRASEGAKLD